MSLREFSRDKYCKTFDDNEVVRMGSFRPSKNGWLSVIRVGVYVTNVFSLTGLEKLKIKVFSDQGYNDKLCESEFFNFSSVVVDGSDLSKVDWLGYAKFTLPDTHINLNATYHPTIEISDYSRTATFVIGVLFDFPDPVYDNGALEFYKHPIAMQIFQKS